MPSWNDGESSSQSWLGDITDLDYAPDRIHDPTFEGIAVDCPEVCRVHKISSVKCVAFEGSNTGQRFYLCSVHNEVENCGFVSWVDQEWPIAAQNALIKLWRTYQQSNSTRFDERIENAKFVEELADDKKKLEKKYFSLLDDVNKFMDCTEKKVWKDNYTKIQGECSLVKSEMEKQKNLLESEIDVLKQAQKAELELMNIKQKKWDDQREALREEKKKQEYMIFDLLKASEANKDKLKRIKEICDE